MQKPELFRMFPDSREVSIKKVLLLGLLFWFVFSPCLYAADWNMYGMSKGEACLYDRESIKLEGAVAKVWTRIVLADKSVEELARMMGQKYQQVRYSNSLDEVECSDKKIRILSIVFYTGENKPLDTIHYSDSKWVSIPPESVFDSLYKKVCEN